MLASEEAITGETWKSGYKSVNLNPDTTMDIEVWLSYINDHLVAAGKPDRLIHHGYSPTDEEVRKMEHGKQHLRSITLPVCYEMLDLEDKRASMSLLSSPEFEWTATEVRTVNTKIPTLKLLVGKNLSRMFKFVKAMKEAVDLGVAEPDDLLPDWSRDRLKNQTLTDIRSKRQHARPTDHDIGVSSNSDLSSFSLRSLLNESPKVHFSRLCLARCRGGPLDVPIHLDLHMTPLQLTILQPSDRDLTVGNLLKEANTHRGAKVGLRRMNILGEVEGLCRVTNTDTCVNKLRQALQLSSTMEELGTRKQGANQLKKVSKAAVDLAKAARKKKAEEKQTTLKNQLVQLTSLLGEGPVNGKSHSASELKSFIIKDLRGRYPKVPCARRKDVMVTYLLGVSTKMCSAGVDVTTAGTFVRNDMGGGEEDKEEEEEEEEDEEE